MHRSQLINLLQAYTPEFSEEKRDKELILQFIESHPDCFERSLEVGHITASCWLVNHDNSAALLMHHAKLNLWIQLGGHCDGDSDVLEVAIKEAQEESGILSIEPVMPDIFDIDIHFIPENKREKAHYHYDIRFLLRVVGDQQSVINHEAKELRWISKDPHTLLTNSLSVTRMFYKWISL